jgi:hypothetical protein
MEDEDDIVSEEEDTLGDLFDDDEDVSVFSDIRESIVSLYKSLDFDQKEELSYILDNIENVPWDWKKWVK